MKWFREIQAVGLKDWLWFVVWMRRNEFHPRLDICNYLTDKGEGFGLEVDSNRLIRDRNRAHRIDMVLDNVK